MLGTGFVLHELPPIPDGEDEENLHAILEDDFDEASEYIYLAN